MIHFDEAHQRVYFPDDRRFVVVLQRRYIVWLIVVIALPVMLAWLQVLTFGIHSAFAPVAGITANRANGAPRGFPVWIRWTHSQTSSSCFC